MRQTTDGYVIAKATPDGPKPFSFVHGTKEDAEKSASQSPSHFVMGGANYHDWRDE